MTLKQKPFSYSWGSGYVAEKAKVKGEYHVPTLQLLKYTESEAAGNVSVRFCHYGHAGNFRRSPLMMSPDEIAIDKEVKFLPMLDAPHPDTPSCGD